MEIQHYLHKHLLTLCEINDDGELLCHGCGNSSLGKAYCCKKCRFYPRRCIACDNKPSGSFYICKQCWPKSPLLHKSCADVPREIQIAYRPHCFLRFEEESISSDMLDCDFCNDTHRNYKFCCDVCRFQIGFGCAAKIIKSHVGGENNKHFSHRHPLDLLEVDDEKCGLCYKNIDGSSYGCAPCEFYIHKSCGEFLQEIQHIFHPNHCLTLQDDDEQNEHPCCACCFDLQGFRYGCDKCDFYLHPECATLKPSIKYEGHDHLLTLVENMSYRSQCERCGFEIHGTFFVRCVTCRLNFHVQCGPDPLPRSILYEHHEHPLSLSTNFFFKYNYDHFYCDACKKERNPKHPFYYCVKCEYIAHLRCVVTKVQFDERENLRHFSHMHALILQENRKNYCSGCWKRIQGPAYGCNPCKFYLHKSCAKLPRDIYHFSHQHCLSLINSCTPGKGTCDSCGKHLHGFIYQCESCNFNLDLDCALAYPSTNLTTCSDEFKNLEGQEMMAHFSHQHPLTLEMSAMNCELCSRSIHGQSYCCSPCKFYIHKSCGELVKEIRHIFHPRHSLKLQKCRGELICDACEFPVEVLTYRCDECDFDLHPDCTSLKPNIKHKGHEHPLILVENLFSESECDMCDCQIHGTFFLRCVECCLNFHVQCGPLPLPPTIVSKQHEHPLALKTTTIAQDDSSLLLCDVCQKERNPEYPVYHCATCEYYVHARCVINEVQLDEREVIRHFSHEHVLFLLENKRNDDIICYACDRDIQADPAYSCALCKLYLHKSCAELPREKQHPFHRHPLSLPKPYVRKHAKCNACHKYCDGFTYCCQDCDFHLDVDCSFLYPSINFEGHKHTLTMFKKLYDNPKCESCRVTSPNKFTPLGGFYFRCVTCDFNVHLLCSPLPQTIEHESHEHPVNLKDNFVDLVDCCYDHEFYCDACETKRDARECVYYCEECSFAVDFDCVFSEVLHLLGGSHQDIQFRIVNREATHKVIRKTYKDILGSFNEKERKTIETAVLDIQEEFKELNQQAGDEATLIISKAFSVWTKDSFQSMAGEYATGRVRLKEIDEDVEVHEVVDVGDYTIISKFAPVLRNLLDKHGDFGASCTLDRRLKTIPLVTFCAIVQEMSNTKVMEINDISVSNWWYYLKLVQRSGFRIDFAFDHFEKILLAHSVTNTEIPRSSRLYNLHEEMAELSQEIDNRTEKIRNLRNGVQEVISGYGTERSRSEAKLLSEALEIRSKNVGTGLL